MEDIVAALLAHDQRRKNNATEESFGDAFLVRGDRGVEDKRGNKKKGPRCFKCKGWGRGTRPPSSCCAAAASPSRRAAAAVTGPPSVPLPPVNSRCDEPLFSQATRRCYAEITCCKRIF